MTLRLHGSCVAFEGVGILLRGPSGAGKSDLALRLIDAGAELVADDQVLLEAREDRLVARAPERLGGLLEVRGLGVVELPQRTGVTVGLVVDLVPPAKAERLPPERLERIEGIELIVLRLDPFENSAVAKLRLAAQIVRGERRRTDSLIGGGVARPSA
jgi:serine kinase of HPr protein (carbohydrate metabolism regulator)